MFKETELKDYLQMAFLNQASQKQNLIGIVLHYWNVSKGFSFILKKKNVTEVVLNSTCVLKV
jgi:hypothetical protein